MKKANSVLMVLAVLLFLGTVYGQTDSSQTVSGQTAPVQTDYNKAIIGTWKFDLGRGYMATIQYKSDGTFEQTVDEMMIGGTYVVAGNTLTTATKNRKTVFIIVSLADNKMTIKRVKDGRTIVYIKQ